MAAFMGAPVTAMLREGCFSWKQDSLGERDTANHV